jgi:hypothetical protein
MGSRIAASKSIGNPSDLAAEVHHDNIEAHAVDAPLRVSAQNDFARIHQFVTLRRRKSDGRLSQGRTGLDLNDGKHAGFFRHDIDLAGLGTQSARQDRPAIGGQRVTCRVLGGDTSGISGSASLTTDMHANKVRCKT